MYRLFDNHKILSIDNYEKQSMVRVEPEDEPLGEKYNNFFKYAAILTMPLEGVLFFGTIMGWERVFFNLFTF